MFRKAGSCVEGIVRRCRLNLLPSSPSFAPATARRRSRQRALLGFGALVALLHLALLGAAGEVGIGGERPAATVEWVTARTIQAEAAAVPVEPMPTLGQGEPEAPLASRADVISAPGDSGPVTKKASTRSHAKELNPARPEPPPLLDDTVATAAAARPAFETPPLAASEFDPADAAFDSGMMKVALESPRATTVSFLAAGERAPPTYRTVLPGPALLRYELRRGIFRGTGEIRWRPDGDRYALQFDARLAGISLLSQSSQGELGVNGLYPVRFVDQRARKAARAVNFSRAAGIISFSGSTAQWPLLAGTQDRLSWMIQLGGIVAADPALATSDRISMILVGARGEASVRSARFAGRENAETVSGSVPALKFVVDGHSAYDGSFEIWLDPARGYLPAHAASRNSAGEAEFELLLQRADP